MIDFNRCQGTVLVSYITGYSPKFTILAQKWRFQGKLGSILQKKPRHRVTRDTSCRRKISTMSDKIMLIDPVPSVQSCYVPKLSKSNSFSAVIDPNIHFIDTQNTICFDDVLFGFMFNISKLHLYDQTMNSRKDLLRWFWIFKYFSLALFLSDKGADIWSSHKRPQNSRGPTGLTLSWCLITHNKQSQNM